MTCKLHNILKNVDWNLRRFVALVHVSLPRADRSRLGICAGKSSIASFLAKEHGFKRLHLERTAATPAVEKSASNATVPHEDGEEPGKIVTFKNADALLDYVTAQWQDHWVTTDVWDEKVLDVFLRRPFFLLVSVDAPVTVRWERFKSRCGFLARLHTLSNNRPDA